MSEWDEIIPQSKSVFLLIKCPDCGNEQLSFSHATTIVHCNICGATLTISTGGKAVIKGEIVDVLK